MDNNLVYTTMLITPSVANDMLANNVNNRNVSSAMVVRYSIDMKNGKWKQNTGETLKISKTGRILDGQHRLHAIVHSGCSQKMDVVRGLDDSVFDVIDTGKSRNAGDAFQIAGIKNAKGIPSMIVAYNQLEGGYSSNIRDRHLMGTNQAILKQYNAGQDFWQDTYAFAQRMYMSFAKLLPISMIGGAYAHLYKKDSIMAYDFIEQLCKGVNVSNESILLLRNVLMRDKMSIKKMTPQNKMMLIMKTWNYFIDGRVIKHLKYDPDKEGKISANTPKRRSVREYSNLDL